MAQLPPKSARFIEDEGVGEDPSKALFREFFSQHFDLLLSGLEWREKEGDTVGLTAVCNSVCNIVAGVGDVGYLDQLMKWAIEREVANTEVPELLFRANTASTKIIASITGLVGKPYLSTVLSAPTTRTVEAVEARGRIEVDPNKLRDGEEEEVSDEQLDDHITALTTVIEDFVENIFNSIDNVPSILAHSAQLLWDMVEDKFPGSGPLTIASFVFLRFICPAIVTPKVSVSRDARRAVVLASKVIQNLANGVLFGDKETYMLPFNPLLREQRSNMDDFMRAFCDGNGSVVITVPDYDESLAVVHAFLNGYSRSGDDLEPVSKLVGSIVLPELEHVGRSGSLAEPLRRAGRALTGVWTKRSRSVRGESAAIPADRRGAGSFNPAQRSRAESLMMGLVRRASSPNPSPQRKRALSVKDVPRLWTGEICGSVTVMNPRDVSPKSKTLDPVETVEELLMQLMALIAGNMSANGKVDWSSITGSNELTHFTLETTRLQAVDEKVLLGSQEKMIVFFVNLYNLLSLHIRATGISSARSRSFYFTGCAYHVGSVMATLDSLEHGVLRDIDGFGVPSNWRLVLDPHDRACVQFGLIRLSRSDPPLRIFKVGTVMDQLRDAVGDYLSTHLQVRDNNRGLTLPKVLDVYSEDFGNTTEEIVSFIFQFLDDELKSIIAKQLPAGLSITYQPYKWEDGLTFISSIRPQTHSQTTASVLGSAELPDKEIVVLNAAKGERDAVDVQHPCVIIADLLTQFRDLYQSVLATSKPSSPYEFDYESFKGTDEYRSIEDTIVKLYDVSVARLSDSERLCFFVNAYNLMHLHINAVNCGPPSSPKDALMLSRHYAYCIGRYTYTLEDIEVGVLSGNPKNRFSRHRHFRSNDPRRAAVMSTEDPRVPLALSNGLVSTLPLKIYLPDNVDTQLDEAAALVCKQVRLEQKRIVLPHPFEHPIIKAASLTSKTTGLLRFVANHMGTTDPRYLDMVGLTEGDGKAKIEYCDADWTPRLMLFVM